MTTSKELGFRAMTQRASSDPQVDPGIGENVGIEIRKLVPGDPGRSRAEFNGGNGLNAVVLGSARQGTAGGDTKGGYRAGVAVEQKWDVGLALLVPMGE